MTRIAVLVLAAACASACGPPGADVYRDHNARDTGDWRSVGRELRPDGSLVVHVSASVPEQAESIAAHIVRQNYATSARPIRIIVDPASGAGERRVYRWDGHALAADTSGEGLPARPPSHSPEATAAAPH